MNGPYVFPQHIHDRLICLAHEVLDGPFDEGWDDGEPE